MNEKMDRRRALGVIAGAALSGTKIARAEAPATPEFLPSPLEQKQLDEQKSKAVNELIDGFWNYPQVRNHISRSFFGGAKERNAIRDKLWNESRMFIPSPQQWDAVQDRNRASLEELSGEIPEKKHGLFLDGDEQNIYLLQNVGQDKMQLIKAYPVSTSRDEWSNAPNSRGTPLGLHRVAYSNRGMLGEVVSSPTRGVRNFAQIAVREKGRDTKKRTFVRSLVGSGNEVAEIVTASFLLTGPATRSIRGIYIHGTNRTNNLGKPDSGGCIRMSNVDVTDLAKYLEIGQLQKDEVSAPGGTPVMLHATRNVRPVRQPAPFEVQPAPAPKPAPSAQPEKRNPRRPIGRNLFNEIK